MVPGMGGLLSGCFVSLCPLAHMSKETIGYLPTQWFSHYLSGNRGGARHGPRDRSLLHEPSNTITYVVADLDRACAVVDSVLDFDMAAGRTSTEHADGVLAFIAAQGLTVEWILETHVHADHLSGAPYLRDAVGGKIGIGARITEVQHTFGEIYNAERGSSATGRSLITCSRRRALSDWDAGGRVSGDARAHARLRILQVRRQHLCRRHVVHAGFRDGALRFSGGDARTLFRSIRRLLTITRRRPCGDLHDYKAPGRYEFAWRTTVGEERERNPHVRDRISRTSS